MTDRKQHARIKAALELRGSSFSSIARELGIAATSVSIVSMGHRRSARIETAIADAIGMTPAKLWPDRYPNNAEGERT